MTKPSTNTGTVYTAPNGATFTDTDIERWAQEAEAGFTAAEFGNSAAGRPPADRAQ